MCCLYEGTSAQFAGVSQSQSTGPDGVTKGECSYYNQEGQSVTVRYREFQNGKIEAQANDFVADPQYELQQCREAAQAGQFQVQQNLDQIQANNQQLQQQLQRQQQQLQENIFRQHQQIFNSANFPHPNNFNPFQFPNFHPGQFGPNF